MGSYRPVYRNGKVHVHRERCQTCVFHPGNLMHLNPGALKQILETNLGRETALVCHEVMNTRTPAVCHGFYELKRSVILELAERMGILEFQDA